MVSPDFLTQERVLKNECDRLQILVDVTNTALSSLKFDDLVGEFSDQIHRFFGIHYVGVDIFDPITTLYHSCSVLYRRHSSALRVIKDIPPDQSLSERAIQNKTIWLGQTIDLERCAGNNNTAVRLLSAGFQSFCTLPLLCGDKAHGALVIAHDTADFEPRNHLVLLQQIAARIAMALNNAVAYQEISRLKDLLASENKFLSDEISHYKNFDQIIAQSEIMAALLEQVKMVAASDSTVLILGETGTGKELIARAIHKQSPRKSQTMVTVNCAAIPSNLLESDLFGHEKGAYTGAASQRLGRFEMANRSTLFLDEVGDIPLALQPKLLRVLQEREIERLGGQKVIPVDVRVIAATSCNLRQMIAEQTYRSDLYYRLNVFPVIVPPLRERPEDIPLLARFFTQKIARRMNRNIETIAPEALNRLAQHSWPGNVRELENVIERAVILSNTATLNLPHNILQYEPAHTSTLQATHQEPAFCSPIEACENRLNEVEQDRIVRILKETNGIVAGERGAAARLGLKRTTLLSRMKRYGISAKSIQESDSNLSA